MYADKLKQFENIENLGGKAWEHAIACDVISQTPVKDCSLHCFHYQQMFELLFKYILETHSEFGAYPMTHKLDKAIDFYNKGLVIEESLGLKEGMAAKYANSGAVYELKGNKAEAKRYYQKSIELYKTIGSPNEKLVQGWLDNLR